jgi:hypothetical protein
MGVLTQLSACSYSSFSQNSTFHHVTIHNEGVYIPFPSCVLKQSNLELNFYLLALNTLNAFYLLETRAKGSRSITLYKCASLNFHINVCATISRCFKICAGLSGCPLASALARLMWEMLLHQIPSGSLSTYMTKEMAKSLCINVGIIRRRRSLIKERHDSNLISKEISQIKIRKTILLKMNPRENTP